MNLQELLEPTVCGKAMDLVSGERQKQYGPPQDSVDSIAAFWTIYLKRRGKLNADLDGREVCQMMNLLKVARDAAVYKEDNLVDSAGYLEIAGMIK